MKKIMIYLIVSLFIIASASAFVLTSVYNPFTGKNDFVINYDPNISTAMDLIYTLNSNTSVVMGDLAGFHANGTIQNVAIQNLIANNGTNKLNSTLPNFGTQIFNDGINASNLSLMDAGNIASNIRFSQGRVILGYSGFDAFVAGGSGKGVSLTSNTNKVSFHIDTNGTVMIGDYPGLIDNAGGKYKLVVNGSENITGGGNLSLGNGGHLFLNNTDLEAASWNTTQSLALANSSDTTLYSQNAADKTANDANDSIYTGRNTGLNNTFIGNTSSLLGNQSILLGNASTSYGSLTNLYNQMGLNFSLANGTGTTLASAILAIQTANNANDSIYTGRTTGLNATVQSKLNLTNDGNISFRLSSFICLVPPCSLGNFSGKGSLTWDAFLNNTFVNNTDLNNFMRSTNQNETTLFGNASNTYGLVNGVNVSLGANTSALYGNSTVQGNNIGSLTGNSSAINQTIQVLNSSFSVQYGNHSQNGSFIIGPEPSVFIIGNNYMNQTHTCTDYPTRSHCCKTNASNNVAVCT